MGRKVKVEGIADFSSIKREVQGLNKTIEDAFGDGIQIFDKESVELLKREVEVTFTKMRTEVSRLTKESKELEKQFKAATGDAKKQEELSRKMVDNAKKRVSAEKELFKLRKSHSTLEQGMSPQQKKSIEDLARKQKKDEEKRRTNETEVAHRQRKRRGAALGTVGHMVADAGSELPGVNAGLNVASGAMHAGEAAKAAGMGAVGIAGLTVLGAAATAAAVAIARMVSGFQVYKQAVPDILRLSGMGVKPLTDSRTVSGAGELGYGQLDVLSMQKDMAGAFGKGSGRQDSNRMLNVLTASRDLGMDPSSIFGGANQLRAAGGTETAQKQMSVILEKAITSGMDKTQATHFVGAAVGLLTEINQTGASQTGALLSTLTSLVSKGNMSPEQAARSLSGMSSAISGSSGESNAFFQTAAARGNMGGGTLLGTEFVTRQGLSGVDMGALGQQIGDTKSGAMGMKAISEMGLGDPNFTQKFAQNILGEINGRFNTDSKEGRAAALGFTGQMFGTKSAPEAAKTLALLEKISKGAPMNKDDKKLLADLGKDPQESWREKTLANLDATARNTAATQAALEKAQFELGKTSAQYINDLTGALIALDNTVNKILQTEMFEDFVETAKSVGKTIGSVFEDIMNLPKNLGSLFDGMMDDPAAFGKMMGEAFVETMNSWWDSIKEFLDKLIGIWDAIQGENAPEGGTVTDFVKEGLQGAKSLAKGFMGGFTGENEEAASPWSKAVNVNGPKTQAGQQAGAPANVDIDQSELLQESRKQTQLLEKMTRPGAAPRAGRQTSRP